jgi:hypothetical protein
MSKPCYFLNIQILYSVEAISRAPYSGGSGVDSRPEGRLYWLRPFIVFLALQVNVVISSWILTLLLLFIITHSCQKSSEPFYLIYCHAYGVKTDRFWIHDQIYWTLYYSAWSHFTNH